MRPLMRRLAAAGSQAISRTVDDAWALLQGTAAATAARVPPRYAFDHPEPFFAPIAALIALNRPVGERGLNAVRLLQGVILGIVVGELTLVTLSGGVWIDGSGDLRVNRVGARGRGDPHGHRAGGGR